MKTNSQRRTIEDYPKEFFKWNNWFEHVMFKWKEERNRCMIEQNLFFFLLLYWKNFLYLSIVSITSFVSWWWWPLSDIEHHFHFNDNDSHSEGILPEEIRSTMHLISFLQISTFLFPHYYIGRIFWIEKWVWTRFA